MGATSTVLGQHSEITLDPSMGTILYLSEDNEPYWDVYPPPPPPHGCRSDFGGSKTGSKKTKSEAELYLLREIEDPYIAPAQLSSNGEDPTMPMPSISHSRAFLERIPVPLSDDQEMKVYRCSYGVGSIVRSDESEKSVASLAPSDVSSKD
ncbi:hypothetical protein L486_02571 [Kwoniella mangroviensis CBS 10435]|uniref:Uncharacterized protein n=1 Tax=Kwoniella mangroviensis CBS 10435 TaxID=1331196 RepID=A0A1B9IWK0_9TREE|nr:hypothetical protein L486_02571 [Kwoniella mangroviensis CBS 10435]